MFDLERSILWTWKVSATDSSSHFVVVHFSLFSSITVQSLCSALFRESYPADRDRSLIASANRDFRLSKTSGWDSVAIERIEEATKEGRGAEVGAIVLGEGE